MSVDYKRFPTIQAAQAFINRMNSIYGYPNAATKTDTIATPVVHPTDGTAIVRVKDAYLHGEARYSGVALRLNDTEKSISTSMTREEAITAGYFPE